MPIGTLIGIISKEHEETTNLFGTQKSNANADAKCRAIRYVEYATVSVTLQRISNNQTT